MSEDEVRSERYAFSPLSFEKNFDMTVTLTSTLCLDEYVVMLAARTPKLSVTTPRELWLLHHLNYLSSQRAIFTGTDYVE